MTLVLTKYFYNLRNCGRCCHMKSFIHTSTTLGTRGRTKRENIKTLISTKSSQNLESYSDVIDYLQNGKALQTPEKTSTNNLIEHTVKTLKKDPNSFLKKIIVNEKNRKKKDHPKLLLEGAHLIQIAIENEIELDHLFYSNDDVLSSKFTDAVNNDSIFKVSHKTFKLLSNSKAVPNIVGVCSKPVVKETVPLIPVTILCSNIRDPSNLGSIVAIASATGCKSLLLTSGCADVWEHKVLNSAEGAHFHIPIINNIKWPDICNFLPSNFAFYVADCQPDIDCETYTDVNYSEDFSTEEVPVMNFLNSSQSAHPIENLENASTNLQEASNYEVPCHMYCSLTFPNKDIVIYIGGETEGVDEKVEQLVFELQGQKIKIPVENGMDSLNVSSALSIVLFEIKRQFEKKYLRSAM